MWQCSDATWWPNLEPMQVAPPDDQGLNQCKLCHLVAQFASDACCSFRWPNLQSVQVAPPDGQNLQIMNEASYGGKLSTCKWQVAPSSGQICNQFKWCQVMVKFSGAKYTSPGVISLIANLDGAMQIAGVPPLWPNLHTIQVVEFSIQITRVTESISGSVVPLAMLSCGKSYLSPWYHCNKSYLVKISWLVNIVKEVKRSDGLWGFACGDVL